MFIVIVCPECCSHSQIVQDGGKTTKCQKCGAKISLGKARVFGKFENIEDAVELRTVLQAKVSGSFDQEYFRDEINGVRAKNDDIFEREEMHKTRLKSEKDKEIAKRNEEKTNKAFEESEKKFKGNPFADEYDYYAYLEERRNKKQDADSESCEFGKSESEISRSEISMSEISCSDFTFPKSPKRNKPKADQIICDVLGEHVIEIDDCKRLCFERGLDEESFDKMLKRLIDAGIVYRPAKGFLGLVP